LDRAKPGWTRNADSVDEGLLGGCQRDNPRDHAGPPSRMWQGMRRLRRLPPRAASEITVIGPDRDVAGNGPFPARPHERRLCRVALGFSGILQPDISHGSVEAVRPARQAGMVVCLSGRPADAARQIRAAVDGVPRPGPRPGDQEGRPWPTCASP
jgi:hypothetical protein